jgi:hypothetical protein
MPAVNTAAGNVDMAAGSGRRCPRRSRTRFHHPRSISLWLRRVRWSGGAGGNRRIQERTKARPGAPWATLAVFGPLRRSQLVRAQSLACGDLVVVVIVVSAAAAVLTAVV